MVIEPIAVFRSPLTEKFGIPRQAGLVPELRGQVVFLPEYRSPEALRGIEGFDYLWLIWGFSLNGSAGSAEADGLSAPLSGAADLSGGAAAAGPEGPAAGSRPAFKATVRPPRLGGNERIGVFASRSPFRPNGLGLSSVRLESVSDGVLNVLGADLADGTPIYDVKPYVEYTDSHPGVRSGFVDAAGWQKLSVVFSDRFLASAGLGTASPAGSPSPSASSAGLSAADAASSPAGTGSGLSPAELEALRGILEQDPRPQYQNDPERIYGLTFSGREIHFKVSGTTLLVL